MANYNLQSASVDEFRFWNKKQKPENIYRNFRSPIDGGSSTDDYRTELSIYFKFNEGNTGADSEDRVVLDYSGRIANGYWQNYSASLRVSGTSFSSEAGDLIIRSSHPDVIALETEMQTSGSNHDANNNMYLYDLTPQWIRDEDEQNGKEFKKLVQIIGSYFDTLYAQVERLPELRDKGYTTSNNKAKPFANRLLSDKGFNVEDVLTNRSILEFFNSRDLNGNKYEKEITEIKNLIYLNIYNNLEHIYKSKGTEKSYRNLLRCFGIDDEIVKLNLYTDNATQYLVDKTKHTSQKTKHIDFSRPARFGATVYQQNFISGSKLERLEKNLALTAEVEVLVPVKPKQTDSSYFYTSFQSSSVFGLDAVDSSGVQYSGSNLHDNFQLYLVKDAVESTRAKWVLEQINHGTSTTSIVLTSSYYDEIYNNQRWNLAVRVYPEGYPFAGSYLTSSNPSYTLELYGVSHNLDEVLHEFNVSTTLLHETGSSLLSADKKAYVGARRTNWSGSVVTNSDVKIAATSIYFDKLNNKSIKQHNKDPMNYGHDKVFGNPTLFATNQSGVHIPAQDSLALHWDFQTVSTSDSSGEFVVEDYSSGSSTGRYGWLENVIKAEHKGTGDEFPVSSTAVVSNEFIFASKKELPEISFTSDTIKIMGDADTYLYEDEDVTDNIFSFEKSMYQSVSENMLNMFSTIVEYSNLFSKPIDRYRQDYKRLDHARQIFFERVTGDMDLDKFTEYFKWIDRSVSYFLEQLHPASAKFNAGLSDMVESHILERPKYQHRFPSIESKTITDSGVKGGIKGIAERRYNWQYGHAPDYKNEDYNAKAVSLASTGFLQYADRTVFTGSSGALSIGFWFTPVINNNRVIIDFGNNLKISQNATNKIVATIVTSGGASVGTTTANPVTTDAFILISWDHADPTNGDVNIHIRGSVVENMAYSAGATAFRALDAGSLQIGSTVVDGDVFDEVSIWDKIMTAADATSIYNSGVAQNLLNHPSASNLVSYYRMGDHPDDPDDDPYKGFTLKDSKSGYHLSVIGVGSTYTTAIPTSFKVPNTNKNIHCLWHNDREERSGTNSPDREQIRKVLTTQKDAVGPSFGDNSQNIYTGGTYALRRFANPYKFSAEEQRTIHGGTNYATPKDRDFIKPLIAPHGTTSDGAPQNVVVLGVGTGQGLIDPSPCEDVELGPTEKEKYNSVAIVGVYSNFDGSAPASGSSVYATPEFAYNIKGEKIFPFNLIKGTNDSGYNSTIHNLYKKDAILTNLHSDTTDYTNEIPIQGPFTNQWVGGRQSRHVGINLGTDGTTSRPEEWRILVGEHESLDVVDGALGFTGPDYGGPYPDATRPWAIRYRDTRAKRPVNVANVSGSQYNLGNYQRNYEVINVVGRKENNRIFRISGSIRNYLATDISVLPETTNQIGLLGIDSSTNGNTQLNFEGTNRISDGVKQQSDWENNSAGNETVIVSRFSAPGGIETGPAYMDVYSKEYSPYNSLNYRNYTVIGRADTGSAGNSGESGTIRVNSHADRREGLNHLHARHSGKFGIDSLHGAVSATDYVAEPSFHKIHRNTALRPISGSSAIDEIHDNFFIQSVLPQSDYNYSWVTSSLGSNYSVRSGTQKVFGFWPKSGILSSSSGFDSAISFPSASQIYGS